MHKATYVGACYCFFQRSIDKTPVDPPTEFSSLKLGDDGEFSRNDTLNLVERLMQVEEESKRSVLNSSPIPQRETSEES